MTGWYRIFILFLIFFHLGLGIGLLKNIDYFHVPEQEFIPFVSQGREYIRLTIPKEIVHPPIYPILISLLGHVIPVRYSELYSGTVVNIFLLMVMSFFAWKIWGRFLGVLFLLPFFFVISHPLTYYVTLQPLNNLPFAAVSLVILYLWDKKYTVLAYALASYSYFIRYEGVALLVTLALADIVLGRKKRQIFVSFFLGIVPIVIWEIIIRLYNAGGNFFVQYALERAQDFPNFVFYQGAFARIPFLLNRSELMGIATGVVMSLIIGGIYFWIKKDRIMIVTSIFLLSYSLLHIAYTDYADRFVFPMLWPLFVLLFWPIYLWKKSRIVMFFAFIIASVGLLYNLNEVERYLEPSKYFRAETRLVGEWLTQTGFDRPVLLITFEPFVTQYYTSNSQVEFFTFSSPCLSSSCILGQLAISSARDVLVVWNTDAYKRTGFFADMFGAEAPPNTKLRLIKELSIDHRWAKIYQYVP